MNCSEILIKMQPIFLKVDAFENVCKMSAIFVQVLKC